MSEVVSGVASCANVHFTFFREQCIFVLHYSHFVIPCDITHLNLFIFTPVSLFLLVVYNFVTFVKYA